MDTSTQDLGAPVPPSDYRGSPAPTRRTVLVVGGIVVMTVAVTALAVTAGTRLQSPEQSAADAAPPSASVVTAQVVRKVLAEPVVLRGVVKAGASVRVQTPASAAGPTSVITDVFVRVGERLREGDVIAVRSGQPLIALDLPFPLYRDVTGGLEGRDVQEVQRALRRSGARVTVTGRMDAQTQAAIRRFFTRRGFTAPTGDPDAVRQLADARAAVTRAQREYTAAVAADRGVAEARAALDAARRTVAGLTITAGPGLPRSVVARIDRSGRKVTAVRIRVGTVLTNPDAVLVELDGEAPYITATATADQAPLLHRGQAATLEVDGGRPIPLKVVSVAATQPANDGQNTQDERDGGDADSAGAQDEQDEPDGSDADSADAQGKAGETETEVRLVAASGRLPAPGDSSLRVEIAPRVSSGPVLAVPVTAIYSRPDGTEFVTVVEAGKTNDVTVRAGVTAGGWVEISADVPGLSEGAEVVVGYGPRTVTK